MIVRDASQIEQKVGVVGGKGLVQDDLRCVDNTTGRVVDTCGGDERGNLTDRRREKVVFVESLRGDD
jgi:hypothetical protein